SLWLVQRPEHLLPGLGPAGDRPGNRVQPVSSQRRRIILLHHLRRSFVGHRGDQQRLSTAVARRSRHRPGILRFRQGVDPAPAGSGGGVLSQPVKIEPTVNAEELTKVLEKMLGKIVGMEIRPYAYRSSFALEEIDVRLADGTQLEILFKDLSRHSL